MDEKIYAEKRKFSADDVFLDYSSIIVIHSIFKDGKSNYHEHNNPLFKNL